MSKEITMEPYQECACRMISWSKCSPAAYGSELIPRSVQQTGNSSSDQDLHRSCY